MTNIQLKLYGYYTLAKFLPLHDIYHMTGRVVSTFFLHDFESIFETFHHCLRKIFQLPIEETNLSCSHSSISSAKALLAVSWLSQCAINANKLQYLSIRWAPAADMDINIFGEQTPNPKT